MKGIALINYVFTNCKLLLWPRQPVLVRTHLGLNLVLEPLVECQGELQGPGVLAAAIKFELLQEPRPIIWSGELLVHLQCLLGRRCLGLVFAMIDLVTEQGYHPAGLGGIRGLASWRT